MNSDAINIAVAKECGWTGIREGQYADGGTDIFGIPPGAEDERPIPDYCHDLNAAMAAARELLPNGNIDIELYDKDFGSQIIIQWDGSTDETYINKSFIKDLSALPAFICEAILQANGVTVDSNPEGGGK